MRVVYDTNVLVSALVFRGRVPRRAFQVAAGQDVQAFTSRALVAEFARVLRAKLEFGDDEVSELTSAVEAVCQLVTPRTRVEDLGSEQSDNHVLEVALEASADYIVTGNLRHLRPLGEWRGIKIRTPREFLDELGMTEDDAAEVPS